MMLQPRCGSGLGERLQKGDYILDLISAEMHIGHRRMRVGKPRAQPTLAPVRWRQGRSCLSAVSDTGDDVAARTPALRQLPTDIRVGCFCLRHS